MRVPHLLTILTAAILAGCGQPQPILAPPTPHGGRVFDLPDKQGSVEVVRRAIADQPGHARLFLYFLDAEMKPMTTPPTIATLKPRGRGAGSMEFRPTKDADPSKAGALECPNIPDQGDITGDLTATVGGKPVAVSINVR